VLFFRVPEGETITTFSPQSMIACYEGENPDFPSTLTNLTLEPSHMATTKFNILPPALTHFTALGYFNQPVDKLPPTLTHLTLGGMFNSPVVKLPPTLTHLKTGFHFN
jgi:hypothetical protein